MLNADLTAMAYRVMVGLAGFSIGLAVTLAVGNIRDALRGDRWSWFWGITRLGYAGIIVVLMPLIFFARSTNQPLTWSSYTFMTCLLFETVGFGGIYTERLRRKKRRA